MPLFQKLLGVIVVGLLWTSNVHAATIVVDSVTDDGPGDCSTSCTLRDAVAVSAAGNTIELPAGLIVLDDMRGEISIDHSLTILGAGRNDTYVSGDHGTRIFRVTAGDLRLEDLTLQEGVSVGDSGGTLTPGAYNGVGGAIRIERDARVFVSDARFSDNQAIGGNGGDSVDGVGGGGGGGHGGAGKGYDDGPGENGHFGGGGGGSGFGLLNGTGGTGGFGGGGGGSGSPDHNPGAPGGVGGGKGGDAGANGYSGGGAGAGLGGAIYVEGGLTLHNVEFTDNQAIGGNGGTGVGAGGGGGGGAGLGSAIFTRGDDTDAGGLLCLGDANTFTGGSVVGGNGGAPGTSGGTAGASGTGLETATGRYEAGLTTCPTLIKVFDVHATVPTGDEGSVLFAAKVTAPFGVPATGVVTFSLEDAEGAVIGSPVSATASLGQALAMYELPALSSGVYTIRASFADPEMRSAPHEATAVLRVPEAPILVRTQNLPVGHEVCTQGGLQIDSGQDDGVPSGIPFDGVLQDGEVEQTHYVCDGVDGTDGLDGTDGVNGTDGQDGTDGVDGVDGQDGYPVIVRFTPIEEGDEECPAGGRLVEAGVDDGSNGSIAGDGILQDGEVRSTSRLCHGVDGSAGPQGESGGCNSTSTPPYAIVLTVLLLLAARRTLLSR